MNLQNCILDNLFIHINHIKNLQEDFKARFGDLLNMEIPEWIISRFDVERKSANLYVFLQEQFIKIVFDIKVKFKYIIKGI